ncbi:SDR family oxidoreductase [Nocardioides humi]|uniref:NAD(P)H-binding protein n=1 Tax=Nocardioides humi TaxID=449461 RepID=A0ABN1ZR64_9ACTN|nr:SDR family oxidoreductase [Nocardioides humi]
MRVAVVGGHGQIARLLHPLLVAGGHLPVALARREEYRPALEALGAELRLLDIESSTADDFVAAFEGCDAVVFSAGGGPDGNAGRKRTVDLEGSLKSIEAAQRLGIRRFVQVSAMVDQPVADDASEAWKAYLVAKRDADLALRDSGLDWTILRPGRLTDAPATDRIALGADLPHEDVTRADVAAVVAAVLDRPDTVGHQWHLIGGGLPVDAAVDAALGG